MNLNFIEVEEIVRRALSEDIGTGDITTALTIPGDSVSRAQIIMKEDGVIAGLEVAALVFGFTANSYSAFGQELEFTLIAEEGSRVRVGDAVAEITGMTAAILTGERTALNILQRMSGIATQTARLVELISHTGAAIVDTRKTTPGLRTLEKYAVRTGGGRNHRMGLYDAVLIKDNHIAAVGGIAAAIERARAGAPHTVKIEIECDTIDQVEQALEAGADMILLDNMSPDTLGKAVEICEGRALTEASGGITEESIVAVAETGVDLISVGALTHSVRALDISLEIAD
ncbi:MAG: carboxylating nicotinate-nucleotide diphosphorylase [Armatimonadota bacterium]|jgi:nicotinate-nucleotide pyrophosphorylase (carboxylating)|nr:carboxylating nicotinate-nucleotide diphosphorylase [Armatimonadota bacterium]